MTQMTYTGRIQKDGQLPVSRKAIRAWKLQPGDKVRITLRPEPSTAKPKEPAADSLDSLNITELKKAARARVSVRTQRRMESLLTKNREATLTDEERREMIEINQAALVLGIRKAQAELLLLQRRS